MLFHSQLFLLIFLPVVLAGWLVMAARGVGFAPRLVWLALASLVFYGWWNPWHVPLLVGSIAVNHVFGRAIAGGSTARLRGTWMWLGIVANLVTLGYFKYTDFILGNVSLATGGGYSVAPIALPLAISFYTFQQISYLVDIARGRSLEGGALSYATYIAFFPQLIAGPIVRHGELVGQFALDPLRDGLWSRLGQGAALLAIGLFKKVGLADHLALIANPVFGDAAAGQAVGTVDAWLASIAFWWQIYFDFSGYSDMAIGMALMFGFRLPLNFDAPMRAASIMEFWQRWHMTLGRFLRDYLFLPLVRGRGRARLYSGLLFTMLLSGLWHGAGWTFVVWGAAHGIALVAHRWWRLLGRPLPLALAIVVTNLFIVETAVLFRAENFSSVGTMWAAMHGWSWNGTWEPFADGSPAIWFVLAGCIALIGPSSQVWVFERMRPDPRMAWATGVGSAALIIWVGGAPVNEFIYFQF
ncbi:MAG: MBOAT family protein [Chromatiales bacterium]|nr:MBOAT family protein [Chromatiales bacterium]